MQDEFERELAEVRRQLAATVIDTNPDLVMFREGLLERVRLAFTHVLMDTVHLSSVENVSHWDTGRRN